MKRSDLIRACLRHRALALGATSPLARAQNWSKYFSARRRLKALPVSWRERETVIDALVHAANEVKP